MFKIGIFIIVLNYKMENKTSAMFIGLQEPDSTSDKNGLFLWQYLELESKNVLVYRYQNLHFRWWRHKWLAPI